MKTEQTKAKDGQASGKRYAELLCDFMFKRMFGTDANKDILIGFLNIILEDVEIKDVKFSNTEHHGLNEEDRKVIFDIECECQDGTDFIIEMQKGYQKHFRERAVYYTTYPIAKQGREAKDGHVKSLSENGTDEGFKWDYNLKPVIIVAILNFKFRHTGDWPEDKFRSSYRLREDINHNDLMTDKLRYVFLELGRFNKYIWELETVFDKWMYLLKHMHEMVEIPKEFSDPMFTRLFFLAEIHNFTPEEKKQYYKSLDNMSDYYNILDAAIEAATEAARAEATAKAMAKGLAEGRAKGMAEGRAKGRAEDIKMMLAAGIPAETIAGALGISVEECEGYRNK